MSFKDPMHPVWKLTRVVSLCCVLLTLQLVTATSYDLDGELITLVGVVLMQTVLEWKR